MAASSSAGSGRGRDGRRPWRTVPVSSLGQPFPSLGQLHGRTGGWLGGAGLQADAAGPTERRVTGATVTKRPSAGLGRPPARPGTWVHLGARGRRSPASGRRGTRGAHPPHAGAGLRVGACPRTVHGLHGPGTAWGGPKSHDTAHTGARPVPGLRRTAPEAGRVPRTSGAAPRTAHREPCRLAGIGSPSRGSRRTTPHTAASHRPDPPPGPPAPHRAPPPGLSAAVRESSVHGPR